MDMKINHLADISNLFEVINQKDILDADAQFDEQIRKEKQITKYIENAYKNLNISIQYIFVDTQEFIEVSIEVAEITVQDLINLGTSNLINPKTKLQPTSDSMIQIQTDFEKNHFDNLIK